MRIWIMLLLAWLPSCIGGCYSPQTAAQAAAYSNPQARAWKSWSGGGVELGTDFSGHAVMEFAPDGRITKLDVTVASKPQDVIKAEGERITENAVALMTQVHKSAEIINESRVRGVVETMQAAVTGVSNVAGLLIMGGAPPERVKGFVESMTPTLAALATSLVPVSVTPHAPVPVPIVPAPNP